MWYKVLNFVLISVCLVLISVLLNQQQQLITLEELARNTVENLKADMTQAFNQSRSEFETVVARINNSTQRVNAKLQQVTEAENRQLIETNTRHLFKMAQKLSIYQNLAKQRGKSLRLREPPETLTISVLMPIYNGEKYFSYALTSLLEQTYQPMDILIGINGHASTSKVVLDIKAEVAKQQPSTDVPIQVFVYDTPSKVKTLHEMVKVMKGTHVALLDVDDEWLPDKLEKQIAILNQYDVDVIGTHCAYIGERMGAPDLPSGMLDNTSFFSNPIINSSTVFRKEHALWDDKFTGVEDYELWLRLATEGRIFYNVPEKLVNHRVHSASAFNTQSHDHKLHTILERYGSIFDTTMEE
jgi:PII-like signaling protein